MKPEEIELIASGLSGLKPFDTSELNAIRGIFGSDVCISKPKALVGETLGAGGAMAMACAVGWLQGIAPAAIISGKAPAKVKSVLVTSMGYYGNASAVILRASA